MRIRVCGKLTALFGMLAVILLICSFFMSNSGGAVYEIEVAAEACNDWIVGIVNNELDRRGEVWRRWLISKVKNTEVGFDVYVEKIAEIGKDGSRYTTGGGSRIIMFDNKGRALGYGRGY